jgi:uncharacterized repeat protein (TIGR01451 family)
MLLTGCLAMAASFGLPMVAAYAHDSKLEKGMGRPDLFISESHLGRDHFQVGDNVTFVIVVGNNSHAGPTISPITVSDSISVGIHNLRVSGHNWDITMSDTKGPAVITAKYLGRHSVHSGEILPAIQISGKLTKDAIPHLTSIARVHTECNCDTSKNKATDTIFVKKAGHDQECNKCKEKKEHKVCQEREKCQEESRTSTQGESLVNNTANQNANPIAQVPSAITVSSVASSNTYNIFGSVVNMPGFSGMGGDPDPKNIPGLPNTGSDSNAGGQ